MNTAGLDTKDAYAVATALKSFEVRIDQILNLLGDKTSLDRHEREYVQELYTELKADLKRAAKHPPANYFEQAFFCRAVQSAAANLTTPTNTHPLRSNWFGNLYSVRIDIAHPLAELESLYPPRI